MFGWSESAWFSMMVGAALKGTVVLGAAWLIAFAPRSRSAAARHLIWTAAAAAVLAIPFLSAGLPGLRLSPEHWASIDTGLVFRVLGSVRETAPAAAASPVAVPVSA